VHQKPFSLSVLKMIEQRIQNIPGRVLITLDGPCASGKTTLAGQLAQSLAAAVLHTDDFVVPHPRKTPDRLAIPGGNCDWERLTAEVLLPWKQAREGLFQRYDFRNDCLFPPEPLPGERLLILEGSYSNLPAIRELADIRLFSDVPEEVRRQRLIRRESPESYQRFLDLWIPLENAYFSAYHLPDQECVRIHSA